MLYLSFSLRFSPREKVSTVTLVYRGYVYTCRLLLLPSASNLHINYNGSPPVGYIPGRINAGDVVSISPLWCGEKKRASKEANRSKNSHEGKERKVQQQQQSLLKSTPVAFALFRFNFFFRQAVGTVQMGGETYT